MGHPVHVERRDPHALGGKGLDDRAAGPQPDDTLPVRLGLQANILGAAAGFYGVNILLTAGIISRWSGEPFFLWTSHLAPHVGVTPVGDDYCSAGPGLPSCGSP